MEHEIKNELEKLIKKMEESLKDTDGSKRAEKIKKERSEEKFDEHIKDILNEDKCFTAIVISNIGMAQMGERAEILSLLTMLFVSLMGNSITEDEIKEALKLAANQKEDSHFMEKEMLRKIDETISSLEKFIGDK